ncbi:hypothetical protein ABEB36_013713 [Hypothenemus hampei]|uniref:Uncharacterized protein n=1 Tax=Hypothenemus hampei TaxID=57062 RepID=A0ABD1E586_HYPHA
MEGYLKIQANFIGQRTHFKIRKDYRSKIYETRLPPCKKKCVEKIKQNQRLQIFTNYSEELKSWDMKRQFIRRHIEGKLTWRSRRRDGSRENQRKQSIEYYLSLKQERIQVCKPFS